MLSDEQVLKARELSDRELDRDSRVVMERWRRLLKAGKLQAPPKQPPNATPTLWRS